MGITLSRLNILLFDLFFSLFFLLNDIEHQSYLFLLRAFKRILLDFLKFFRFSSVYLRALVKSKKSNSDKSQGKANQSHYFRKHLIDKHPDGCSNQSWRHHDHNFFVVNKSAPWF